LGRLKISVDAKSNQDMNEKVVSKTTEYFEDGNYMTITVTEEIGMKRGTVYQKTGFREVILHNSSGAKLWSFTVYGSFSVDPGVSATCTEASYTISIADSAWENESASAFRSENQAIGDANFNKKLLGITVESKGCHVVLTCDSDGNLS